MRNKFIESAATSLKEAASLMNERGNQYSDTWGEDACWNLTKSVVRQLTDKELDSNQLKSIALAAFVDQKYSRFAGGYKHDTAIDLIPYIGALADSLKQKKCLTRFLSK